MTRRALGWLEPDETERVSVLSGGGAFISYHVGALEFAICQLGKRYRWFYGVSSGALVSAWMSMYSIDEQPRAVAELKDLILNLHTKDIYCERFGGIAAAVFAPSVYDSTPLLILIQKMWDAQRALSSGVKAKVGAVCWDTGEYRMFVSTESAFDIKTYASASYPVFFLPAIIDNKAWGDGGLANVTPVRSAIVDGHMNLDVTVCEHTGGVAPWDHTDKNGFPGYLLRMLHLWVYELTTNDLQVVSLENELTELKTKHSDIKMNLQRPDRPLRGDSLEFNPEHLTANWRRGYEDAAALSQQGVSG